MNALTIAGFELRSRLKLVSTWVYFLIFFAVALLWIAAAGGLFKEANVSFGSGKVAVNSPYALAQTVSILGMFGITVMAAIMGRAVQQDVEYRTQSFFFTAPIGKLEYLGGRFLDTGREGFRTALEVSAYSLAALCRAAEPHRGADVFKRAILTAGIRAEGEDVIELP